MSISKGLGSAAVGAESTGDSEFDGRFRAATKLDMTGPLLSDGRNSFHCERLYERSPGIRVVGRSFIGCRHSWISDE